MNLVAVKREKQANEACHSQRHESAVLLTAKAHTDAQRATGMCHRPQFRVDEGCLLLT
jgi:hypothetical protein